MIPIELMVTPHPEEQGLYRAEWADGETVVERVPEIFLDLIPFMLARRLLEWGYNVERELIVKLQGADYELMHAPLGAAAATPLPNMAAPVTAPARAMIARSRHG